MSRDRWVEVPQTNRSAKARIQKPHSTQNAAPAHVSTGPAGNRTSYVQDAFYQHLMTERSLVEVVFLDGMSLIGVIDGFDTYAILLLSNGEEILVFKSAIRYIHLYLGDGNEEQNV
ncbi:RNA chaperone Hfq [Sulfobacillus thermosulfidooxidans DSM 9293]|uniref:RNA chaperone Hfq n=2 Tax=Sulfobacillus thermosulfidooxidans TaxID=28034 RepID=A0A1W1WIT0_SULTA|nr:RNA chaperone Hfq [Sulfobacillus thermosulfidooxidans]PSR29202.1 MAG: hypothetical protein C7B47_02445 [Sulfobacillus thermosulfidooxidans]SMC06221.1 RNA chaperone Hfq [Sulfobacillus thermosulfidooxidans DSM 9293]